MEKKDLELRRAVKMSIGHKSNGEKGKMGTHVHIMHINACARKFKILEGGF